MSWGRYINFCIFDWTFVPWVILEVGWWLLILYIKLCKNSLRPGGKICYILDANTRLSPEILVNCRKLVTILSERAQKWVKSIGVTLFGLLLLKRDTQLGWGRQKLTPQSRKKVRKFCDSKNTKILWIHF